MTGLKRLLFILGFISLSVIGGFLLKRYYFNPGRILQRKAATWEKRIKEYYGNDFRTGDLIFQTSLSRQSVAVQLATKSRYSHCGIIFQSDTGRYNWYVLEAVQPVKFTPLARWIARGKDGRFIVKRLKDAERILTPSVLGEMRKVGSRFVGRNYDLTFEWTDDKLYCSELVWKLYQRTTGLEIGKLQKLRDFDLTNATVKEKLKERYGSKIPMDETVISPVEIYNSDLLMPVHVND